ncbi:MAG: hypothetical protein RLY97_1651 [Pseudomonadota bacterium]|jgi:hypothetical protein
MSPLCQADVRIKNLYQTRHPREGGDPSPNLCFYHKLSVMDSRLRGNDE